MIEWFRDELTLKNDVAELRLIPLGRVGDGGTRGLKSISKIRYMTIKVNN